MVKFVESLEYIGTLEVGVRCNCCGEVREHCKVYKKDEEMVVICPKCQIFIEELLD